ncbi:LysM domain-containing protein [Nocardioides sp.]|uniref:LysM peptidoglycan-binding domain-containing protein n=1 Tax=Nocardioides sp. TaxID=35761 RepID=UPI003219E895
MSTQKPEKVFPDQGGDSKPPKRSRGLKGVDRKWVLAGAALATVGAALVFGRGDDADPEASGEGGGSYELDTSETDLYNELQPELEAIRNALEDDRPRPPTPTPATEGTPQGNGAGPRPGGGPKAVRGTHRVKQGDTLRSIAKDRKVRGGPARLYAVNRKIIARAAKQNKDPRPNTTRTLYPGTVLVIPVGRKGK